MKLYATLTNSKGKKEGIGDDKYIEIDLTLGNNHIGRIILDYQGGNDWDLSYERQGEPSYLIDSKNDDQDYYQKETRQKQQGEIYIPNALTKKEAEDDQRKYIA